MPRRSLPSVVLTALLGLALAAPAAAAPSNPRAAERIPERWIVVYHDAVERPGATTDRLERTRGFQARLRYASAVKGFAARLTDRQVAALRADPAVDFVTPDRPARASAAVPLAAGDAVPPGVRRIGAGTASSVREASDAHVAVIDTGIDLAHPDLNALNGANCVTPGAPAQDDEGHGTHVAGTIGARNQGAGVVGVAPGTRLYAVKVLDASGNGAWSQIICGIDWVTSTRTDADPANDVAVANMSLGGPGAPVGDCATTTDAMHRAICASTAAGVTYVVAAGNDGWDFDYAQTPDVPAAYPQVLTVTAMGDTDGKGGALGGAPSCTTREADDRYASFSNFPATAGGLAHAIAGPGVCIRSTAPGGGYATMSGTSMATPHLAGLLALCLSEAGVAGPCAGLAPAQAIANVRAEADAFTRATASHGFVGDPLRPVNGFTFGFLAHLLAPAAPPPPDTTPPTATASTPASGATGVAPSSTVSVTFSEPMDATSAQTALTLVRASDGAAVAGAYSWSGTTLTLRPSAPLAEGTSYTARLAATATDAAGNALASGRTWSFTTWRTVSTPAAGATVEAGTLRAGGLTQLAADDNLYYELASTTTGTRTTQWQGRVTGVSNAAKTLLVRYRGRSSSACSQTVSVYRWTTGTWVQLDVRTVGTTEVLVDKPIASALADYVSGTSGDGEVRVRVRCTASGGSFVTGADVLRVIHTRA